MTKLLYVIISGEEESDKFDRAIFSAVRIAEKKRVEDIKVLFFGNSETLVTKATGDRRELIEKLINLNAVDSACVGIAKRLNIEEELKSIGIAQEDYSLRIAAFLDDGYVPMTF